MKVLDEARCYVTWIDDWAAVSPGQAAVLYDLENEELLAGGRIAKES
jgi:tRNA U34 2-thiouridine synthase MnmA/TrmU